MRWRGFRAGAEPLLFVLHLGYGWLAFGLLLMGANQLLGFMDPTSAFHALTAGAIGTMTLAVMTRATRGHTGRALAADPGTVAIFVAVTLAAVARVGAPFTCEYYFVVLGVAAGLWCLAYGLFVLLYARMLMRPRVGNTI
jgi:uncharacterized protein involved in response to NO